jgi:hypothetical protein
VAIPLATVATAGVVLGVALAIASVVRLVRLARQPPLARVPLTPVQQVTFAEAGPAELALEGPRFTTRLGGLAFTLADAAGRSVPLQTIWFRTRSDGMARSQLSLHRLEVPQPGAYELRVGNLDERTDYSDCAVAFVRPRGASMVFGILGLLGSIGLAAASVAVVAVLLVGGSGDAPPATAIDPTVATEPGVPATAPARPTISERGGHPIVADERRLEGAREIVWPLLQMRVRVPPDWVVRKLSDTELDVRHPTAPSTFLVARASPMPAGPSIDEYLAAHVAHAREQLADQTIDGYATATLGTVRGVATVERRQDGSSWLLTWTGFEPAQVGSLSVTVLAGAAGADLARDETLLGAMVESIRFE